MDYQEEFMMYCPNCGANIKEGATFCDQCGVSLQNSQMQQTAGCEAEGTMPQDTFTAPVQVPNQNTNYYGAPQYPQNTWQTPNQYAQPQPQPMNYGPGNQPPYSAGNQPFHIPIRNYDPSKDYTPIGMWGYFGYQLLFAIPFIGFILILIFSFGGTRNINLRNYARSTFCLLIIVLGVVALIALFGLITSLAVAGH